MSRASTLRDGKGSTYGATADRATTTGGRQVGHRQPEAQALSKVSAALLGAAPALFPLPGTGRPTAEIAWHRPRARCSLTRLDLAWGQQRRSVLVKIRSAASSARIGERDGRPRPVEAPDLPPAAAAELEHAGLQALAAAVDASGEARFGVVRPLLLVPEQAALVLDFVGLPTLRQELVRSSRLRSPLGRARTSPWRNTGSLLALYHRSEHPPGHGAHLTRRDGLERLLGDLVGYLGPRRAPAALLRDVERRGGDLLSRLPDELPARAGHGDFSARNLFVDPHGRVSLFDPMPRWHTPPADDLASFIVGMRLTGGQLATRGAAFSRPDLDRREAALLDGYGLARDDPALNLLVIIALLDRWCWLASAPTGEGVRRRVRAARAAWLRQEVYRETRRLLDGSPRCARPGKVA